MNLIHFDSHFSVSCDEQEIQIGEKIMTSWRPWPPVLTPSLMVTVKGRAFRLIQAEVEQWMGLVEGAKRRTFENEKVVF